MDIVQRCLTRKTTANHEAVLLGIHNARILEWIFLYQSLGENKLRIISKNTVYSADTKEKAILEYLNGEGFYSIICRKYGILSSPQLRKWSLKYDGWEKLKVPRSEGCPIMTKGRKTTFDERVEIVQYCISHEHNYSETAEKYQISYQQTRNYTILLNMKMVS